MAEFDSYANDYNRTVAQSIAASGETPQYFADYKARHLIDRVPVGSASKVLDFGCGIGNLVYALHHRVPGVSVDGYDPSSASLERISSDIRKAGRFSADLSELDSDYDAVVMAGVLHHIPPRDRARVIDQAIMRLGTHGSLVVFEHNPLNPITRRVVDACPLDKDAILLPAAETLRLMKGAGLISVRRDYIVFFSTVSARPASPGSGAELVSDGRSVRANRSAGET